MVTPTNIVLFDAGVYDGNLGGRAGVDAICQASGKRPAGYANVRAFISVNAGDSIANMPGNYGIPTNVPIVGPNGTELAANWADLLDGSIAASLQAAGIGGASLWWSGSNPDGSLGTTLGSDSCAGWTDNGPSVRALSGDVTQADGRWLDDTLGVGYAACSNNLILVGIAF